MDEEVAYRMVDGELVPSTAHESTCEDPFATFEEWSAVDDVIAYRELQRLSSPASSR